MKGKSMDRRDFFKHSAAALAAGMTGVITAGTAAAQEKPGMKKAIQLGMLNTPKGMSDAEKFKLAKACGYEGIEGGVIADLEAAKKFGDLAREAGTPIHSIVYGGWDAPLSDPDPAVVEKGLKNFEASLHSAKAQGAGNVLLVPVVVNAKATTEQAWERSQKLLPKVIPLAAELQITIGIEPVWNNFLLEKPAEFARYVDEFKSPWVKAYFDTGNVVKYGKPEDWIRALGKRTVRIHLKDFKREGQKWTNLRDGDVNWPEVHKALTEVGYAGFLTPELDGGDEKYLRDLSERIDLIIAGK
jgi:hexulose-6-phosphate isomerase